MKTINPKNALKLFLFLLILCSAKTFSQLPKFQFNGNSNTCEAKYGWVKKGVKPAKTKSNASYAMARVNFKQTKNNIAKK